MNIFITGAEGFIGRNLVRYLLVNTTFRIFYCDNGDYSIPFNFPLKNRVEKVCNDISEIEIFHFKNIDILIHLAAVKKHNSSFENEYDLLNTNIIQTRRIFALAVKSNIKQIIFASSLYAAGNMKKLLFSEFDLPVPSTLYGSSKFFGESCLRELSIIKKISYVALRLYFIYGPEQYYGKGYPSVFINTLNALHSNKNPIIINNGKQKLDYLFVDDLSCLILNVINTKIAGYTLCNASSSSAYEINFIINSLVELWNAKFNTNFTPVYQGKDFTDGSFRSGANDLAKELFNWEPNISINEGLKSFFNWYIKNLNNDL
jgi:nucleoside-diphosphate-sugar epimerase